MTTYFLAATEARRQWNYTFMLKDSNCQPKMLQQAKLKVRVKQTFLNKDLAQHLQILAERAVTDKLQQKRKLNLQEELEMQ